MISDNALGLSWQVEAGIMTLFLDRPRNLNAVNRSMLRALSAALATAEGRTDVRVVVVTGRGDKAFCVGADIREMTELSEAEYAEFIELGKAAFFQIEQLSKPSIAAVNGYAFGGGLELALACDLRYAAAHAALGLPEVTLGVIPGWGGTQRLPRLVGEAKARELILLGRSIDAEEARRIGLVAEVVAGGELPADVMAVARELAGRSPAALSAAKASLAAAWLPGGAGFDVETDGTRRCFATPEFQQTLAEFVRRRAGTESRSYDG